MYSSLNLPIRRALALFLLAAGPFAGHALCGQCSDQGAGSKSITFGNANFGGTSGCYVFLSGKGRSDLCGGSGHAKLLARTWVPVSVLGKPLLEAGRVEATVNSLNSGIGASTFSRKVYVSVGQTVLYTANLSNGVYTLYSSGVRNLWQASKSKSFTVGTGSVTLTGNLSFSASFALTARAAENGRNLGAGLSGSMTVAGESWALTATGGTIKQQTVRFPIQTLTLADVRAYEWTMLAPGGVSRLWGTSTFGFTPYPLKVVLTRNGTNKTVVNWTGTAQSLPVVTYPLPAFPF